MKGDKTGAPRVTELNAGRFGTTHYFYTAAGANFPELLLRIAHGESPDVPRFNILPEDLVWIRTLDAGPVLTTRSAIQERDYPTLATGDEWPLIPQSFADFEDPRDAQWPPLQGID